MADEINYSIQGIKAEHFTGPISSSKNQWRTVPDILRAVASWMDETDLQDPECEGLVLKCAFDDNGDDFYKTVTVYYLELENERKSATDPTEKGV